MNAIPAAGYKNKSGVQLIPLYTINLFVSKKSKCNSSKIFTIKVINATALK